MRNQRRLGSWLAQKQISIRMSRVMCNPNLIDEQIPGALEHFRCRLFKRGGHVDFYLSIGPEGGAISPDEALFMLAMDAASCRLLEGYVGVKEDWISDLGDSDKMMAREARTFWKEYAARCSQQRRLRSFLGDAVYDEMLERLETDSDLTEVS